MFLGENIFLHINDYANILKISKRLFKCKPSDFFRKNIKK